jgi:hypothetical protein
MSSRCVFFHSQAIPKRAECAERAYFSKQYCALNLDYADIEGGRVKFSRPVPAIRAAFQIQSIFENNAVRQLTEANIATASKNIDNCLQNDGSNCNNLLAGACA